MSQQSTVNLSPQELVHQHKKVYFFIQMGVLIQGAFIIVVPAQLFLEHQLLAMFSGAIISDLYREIRASMLSSGKNGDWTKEENRAMRSYFLLSTPRRWLGYALLSLPLNALLTYVLHSEDFSSMNNAATWFMNYSESVLGLVIDEATKLKSGAATLTVDFGIVGILEYLAMRYVFAKRKLKKSKKT